jgi:hypothetical protein
MKKTAIQGEVYFNIEDVRNYLRKKGGIQLVNSFDKFIKIKCGLLQDNIFYIKESDYKEWGQQA